MSMTTASRKALSLLTPLLAACALLSACGSSSNTTTTSAPAASTSPTSSEPESTSGSESGSTIKTASVSSLHATALVNTGGMTLYHLSGEGKGKFICTSSACLQVWHPLTVPAGTEPSGSIASLGTVKRPDGTTQVTYEGAPLYTFADDKKPGEASGQGIKDVGTWMAATTSESPSSQAPAGTTTTSTQPSSEPSSSGGGGYGY